MARLGAAINAAASAGRRQAPLACRAKLRLAKNRFANTTAICGSNADLILAACRLYLAPHDSIADLTYGRGVFGRKVGPDIRRRVIGSDIFSEAAEVRANLRYIPYRDKSFDVAVLDPPYVHTGAIPWHLTADRYNAVTIPAHSHAQIRKLYQEGLKEAARIARRQVWVKCKDEIESSKQCWAHIEIFQDATALGLYARDLFHLIPRSGGVTGRPRARQRYC